MIDVSVIIPCYNRASLIGDSIRSVLRQNTPAVEVIVIDDGSTDTSWSVIEGFGESVRSFRIPNGGVSAARNLGIDHAKGRFIRFLDSDDRMTEGAIKGQLAAAAALPVDHIAVGDAIAVDAEGAPIDPYRYGYAAVTPPGVISRAVMIRRVMSPLLPLFPANALRTCGGFNTKFSLGEDYELAMRLSRAGYTFVRVPVTVCEVREHAEDRLSRNYGASGYRRQQELFQHIWAGFNASTSDQLSVLEKRSLGRIIWTIGRNAKSRKTAP